MFLCEIHGKNTPTLCMSFFRILLRNAVNVARVCIFAMVNFQVQKLPNFSGPLLGPKPADENKRNFTEEEIKAARDSHITTMAGSYKVSQSTLILADLVINQQENFYRILIRMYERNKQQETQQPAIFSE